MDNTSPLNISDIIKRVRAEQKLSQRDFAMRLDISLRTVQNWEYKESSPTRANIQRMIEEFDLRKEDYPELFDYLAAPRKSEPQTEEITEAAPSEGEPDKKSGEDKMGFLKRLFNSPFKMVLLSVMTIFAAFGLFIIIYFSCTSYIGTNVVIILACGVAAAIAIPLAVYFLLKRHKK